MILDDVATYLAAASTSFVVATNLFKSVALDSGSIPSTVTVLYETPGGPNEYTFSTSTAKAAVQFERPGLQVLNRSTAYTTARSRAQTVYTTLDGVAAQTLSGTTYLDITAVQAPFFIGRDENDRYLVSVNFNVWKTV